MESIKRARQSGFTLIEIMLVMVLVGIMTVSEIQQARLKMEQLAASNLGKVLFEYNNAVRFWISEKQSGVTALNVTPDLQGARTGVDWLKSASCDPAFTADKNYLGCNFLLDSNGRTRFGNLQFETYFNASWNAALGQSEIEAITVMVDDSNAPVMRGLHVADIPRPDLAGLAAAVVGGIVQLADSPFVVATGGEAVYCISNGSRAGMCDSPVLPAADYAVEKIVLRAANYGTANPCSWLRTDGSCHMQADLTFNPAVPFDQREILNVSRILDSGTEGLQIGAAGGYAGPPPLANFLLIDANMSVWQDLVVNNSDLVVNNGRIEVAEGLTPGSGEIEAHAFVDRDDNGFFVDPSSGSSLNEIEVSEITNNIAVSPDLSIRSDNEIDMVSIGDTEILSQASLALAAAGGTTGLELDPGQARLWSDGSVVVDTFGSPTAEFGNDEITLMSNDLNIETDISRINLNVDGNTVSLSSLLPNWIHDQTWLARQGEFIPYPACQPGWSPKGQIIPINILNESRRWQSYTGQYRKARLHWEAWLDVYASGWVMRGDSSEANDIASGIHLIGLVNTYCYKDLTP